MCQCDQSDSLGDLQPTADDALPAFDFADVHGLAGSATAGLFAVSTAAKSAGNNVAAFAANSPIQTQLHVVPTGGVLVTSAFAGDSEGDVVLRGNIGPFPYELHLKLRIEGTTVIVTAKLTKPFEYGPIEWRFKLGGVREVNGQIVSATTVTPSPDTPAMKLAPLGLDWWCVLKCGGLSILGILVKCLPALGGGIPGYVACVTSQAGSGAASIAICIATKCR